MTSIKLVRGGRGKGINSHYILRGPLTCNEEIGEIFFRAAPEGSILHIPEGGINNKLISLPKYLFSGVSNIPCL